MNKLITGTVAGTMLPVSNSVVIKEEPESSSCPAFDENHGSGERLITETAVAVCNPVQVKQEPWDNVDHINGPGLIIGNGAGHQVNSDIQYNSEANIQSSSLVNVQVHTEQTTLADCAAGNKQRLHLLSMLEESPELSNNRVRQPGETKQQRNHKWEEISRSLNAMGPVQRTATSWMQYWKDWRYRVRSRARILVQKLNESGSNGSTPLDSGEVDDGKGQQEFLFDPASHLSAVDCRVMALMKWDTATDCGGTAETSPKDMSYVIEQESQQSAAPSPAGDTVNDEELQSAQPDDAPSTSVPADRVAVAAESMPTIPAETCPSGNYRPPRKRRRRVPPSIANEVLTNQKLLVDEVRSLRRTMAPLADFAKSLAPMAEYFQLMLEKAKGAKEEG